jgi:hypothetical protein
MILRRFAPVAQPVSRSIKHHLRERDCPTCLRLLVDHRERLVRQRVGLNKRAPRTETVRKIADRRVPYKQ